MGTRKLTTKERKDYASKLRKMEAEIHSQVSAYIKAFELGKDERFLAGMLLASEGRKDMRMQENTIKKFVTDGVGLL